MQEGVRARVEIGDEREATRTDADEGEVSVEGATFRFSVDRPGADKQGARNDDETAPATDEPPTENGDSESSGSERTENADIDDPRYLAPVEEVPTNGTIRCEALGEKRGVEFICRQEDGEAFAWRNSCPHEPEVKLDPGWGAFVRDGQIVCHEHGARFETGDGLCTYGPCRGKVLDPIGVEVRDNGVYLTDERFEAGRRLR